MNYKIIRHKNPKGKTTWYQASYIDNEHKIHKSIRYTGSGLDTRRRAQNWLYANIHIWCNIAHIEQRIIDDNGNSKIIELGTEEIILKILENPV